jgi:predicted DNA-binding transcriptional regulator AlpA
MHEADRIVRDQEATHFTGLSKSRRHELTKAGEFPKKVKLSERASGYRLSELQAWIASRPSAEQSTPTATVAKPQPEALAPHQRGAGANKSKRRS